MIKRDNGSKRIIYITHKDEVRFITNRPTLCKHNGNIGIRPRNAEQTAAVDAILNPANTLICLMGKAGTGKTMLAIACALQLYFNQRPKTKEFQNNPNFDTSKSKHKRGVKEWDNDQKPHSPESGQPNRLQIYITRPMVSVGKEMGFLPGTIEEKISPWMSPILDNLHWMLGSQETDRLIKEGIIKMQPISLIRGRTFHDAVVVLDECQNLTPLEVKTIITRAGVNCKMILTGDPDQIDNPYIDKLSNGLTYAADRMGLEDYVAVIPLTRGERSRMSERAAELL